MDTTTVIVAALGIFGTLLSPFVVGRVQHRNWVAETRTNLYSELLEVAIRLQWKAHLLTTAPTAEVEGPTERELRALEARVRALGSDKVREHMLELARQDSEFHRVLTRTRLELLVPGDSPSPEATRLTMRLGEITDELGDVLAQLERTIREELN